MTKGLEISFPVFLHVASVMMIFLSLNVAKCEVKVKMSHTV